MLLIFSGHVGVKKQYDKMEGEIQTIKNSFIFDPLQWFIKAIYKYCVITHINYGPD